MKKGVIDRFDEDIVLIEIDGEIKEFPRSMVQKGAREGDAVILYGERISIDQKETAKLRKKIQSLMDKVWED